MAAGGRAVHRLRMILVGCSVVAALVLLRSGETIPAALLLAGVGAHGALSLWLASSGVRKRE
jgi:hypothetical protein